MACCASTRERAEAFAANNGVATALDDWRELVAHDGIDVVAVLVPNVLHHPVATAALAAGKHVIVEKPLAMTLEECAEIRSLATERSLVVGYAENICFAPKYVRAKEVIESGDLGDVRVVKQIEKHDGPHNPWEVCGVRKLGGKKKQNCDYCCSRCCACCRDKAD